MEKVSQNYDPVALTRILQSLERRVEALQQPKLRRIKSVAAEAAQNLAVNEVGYVLSDTGQNFDLVVHGEDGRLYRITGAASSSGGSSGSGGTTDHGSLSGLGDDDHTQYHNDARALTWIGTRSTSDLPEGSNQYFTTERAQDAVGGALVDTSSIDFTYNDGANTISAAVLPAGVDHGGLGGLLDDDHTQYVLRSILTTKGDLFVRDASVVNRLGVGTDGHIFIADSAQATGVKWAAPSAVSLITDTESRMFSMMVGIH